MSGRKSSEVYAVLNRIESGLDNNVWARQRDIQDYKQQEQQLQDISRQAMLAAGNSQIPKAEEARKRFGREVENKQETLTRLLHDIQRADLRSYGTNIEAFLQGIQGIRNRSEVIGESVREHDYNNSQYSQAVSLEQDLNREMNAIKQDVQAYGYYVEGLKKKASELQRKQVEAEGLKNEIQNLETQAVFLKKQEKEANALRDALKEKLNNFDTSLLEKYKTVEVLRNNYEQTEQNLLAFIQQGDAAVIAGYSQKIQQLEKAQSEAKIQIETLDQQKRELEDRVKEFQNTLSGKNYIDCKNGTENAFTLEEFITEYGVPISLDGIKSLLAEIGAAEQDHEFSQGLEKLSQAHEAYQRVRDEALTAQERIQGTFWHAQKAQAAMHKLSFDTHVDYMADGKAYDGIKLTASQGDRNIHFEPVFGEDGLFQKFNFNDLDKNGNDATNCETTWSEICDAMVDQGCYINQVYKNGQPLIKERKQATSSSAKKQEQQKSST